MVRNELAPRIIRSLTSITRLESDHQGYAHATGSYIKQGAEIYLLTNEHVIREALGCHLGHIPGPNDDYRFLKDYLVREWPYDIAMSKLTSEWQNATKIPLEGLFDMQFQPVMDEVLLIVGFPGTTAERFEGISEMNQRRVVFDHLISPAQDFAVQVCKRHLKPLKEFDPKYHFAVGFPHTGHIAGIPLPKVFPNPQGLSGSLVWDTKFVASTMLNQPWSPDKARICGLVRYDYRDESVLLATKVEYVIEQIQRIHKAYSCAIRRFLF